MINESKLLERLSKNDASAYKLLFDTYYIWLCNYVCSLCNDPELAEDLAQETMIKFWEKRKKIIVKISLKNYLFRTCHNEFLQHIRKKKIKVDFLDQVRWDALTAVYEEEKTPESNRIEILNKLIDQLPPRCKEVFILNKLERRKYKEIANDLGISIKTVENHMSKALSFLREHATSFML
ncbi:RNA polymerase sigma-70 factor [Psychroserpens burtonensis]|uniref:RNA polymerase sigma-70 factor n=1 Tax=Psychroserpens burtonensis TaxID=49278 RepID=A0A5C7B710_9FLAO|nr:RNA polymerase sigma-70 factor [Psychroserpens burtonensis]TXE16684.1 RNA polymerase sigma-70 factor [Psychroserpens burtonensis]